MVMPTAPGCPPLDERDLAVDCDLGRSVRDWSDPHVGPHIRYALEIEALRAEQLRLRLLCQNAGVDPFSASIPLDAPLDAPLEPAAPRPAPERVALSRVRLTLRSLVEEIEEALVP